MTSFDIAMMTTPDEVEVVRGLILSYVQWLTETYPDETDDLMSYYSPEQLRKVLDEIPTEYAPPKGLTLIAYVDGVPVGCAVAHPLERGVSEMKRLFVHPSARGKGIATRLITTLKDHMAAWGHPTLRLDTATFLTDAIAVYRRLGFIEIPAYYEIPPLAVKTTIFMEWKSQTGD